MTGIHDHGGRPFCTRILRDRHQPKTAKQGAWAGQAATVGRGYRPPQLLHVGRHGLPIHPQSFGVVQNNGHILAQPKVLTPPPPKPTMAKIAVTDGMDNRAVAKLRKAGHEVVLGSIDKAALLSGALEEFDAIIVRSATKLTSDVLKASGKRLKVIGRAGVGVDNIDLETAGELGIPVVNAREQARNPWLNLRSVTFLLPFVTPPTARFATDDGKNPI